MAFNGTAAFEVLAVKLSAGLGRIDRTRAGFDNTPNLAGTGTFNCEDLKKHGDMLAMTAGSTPDIGDNILGFGSAKLDGVTGFY